MERMILSLKSIYMLLMTDDFPIYSESVICKADRKGQTLLRFWRGLIAEEFRSLPYGRMIWRSDEKRNRYTSYLCNRSMELRCYREYAKEISSQISTAALLNQISRFTEFLSGRKYRQDILIRRIQELVRLTEDEDARVTEKIAQQIKAGTVPVLREEGSQGELFQAGYLLTLLTLYAAVGEAMDDASMAVLRGEEYGIEELWKAHNRKQEYSRTVVFLTVHCSMLQDNRLPQNRFFGREVELYDLREMAAANRKCLISGIGGIGKTEMLRQLLYRCEEEGAADQIAVIPYQNNIIESFTGAFPDCRHREPEEEFHRILYQIEQKARQGCRILLLIDDVCKGIEEDSALGQLRSLPCSIFITTRNQCLEGFETYRLQPPAVSAGTLIFRDNYGRALTKEDRIALTDMLADEMLRYPVTLRLIARAAKSKGWSVEQIKKQLTKNGVSISWQEGDRTVRLNQMFRQLYSYMRIPPKCQALVELFTLLPWASYSVAFLKANFPEVTGKAFPESAGEDSLEEGLAAMAAGGWLEEDGSGYAMHPLIAQCLRRRIHTEERLEPVLGHIRNMLLEFPQEHQIALSKSEGEELQRICHIFLSVCRFLSGSISRELMLAILSASLLVYPVKQEAEEKRCWLEELMKRCSERDDQTEVFLCAVLGQIEQEDAAQCAQVYYKQKERLTVPVSLFLDFCIYAGASLSYRREFALAEQLLREGLSEAASPFQKAISYYKLSLLLEFQGDWDGQLRWVRAGEEYVTAHPECGEYVSFLVLCMRWAVAVKHGQREAAESLKEKLQSLLQQNDPLDVLRISYENIAGLYELTFGSEEQALEHYSRCLEHYLTYQGKRVDYYITLGQVVIVLQRMRRYEEAISAYGTLLDYARDSGDAYMLQRFSNNLSVLYLDMEKPEEALTYLQTALEEGQKFGGVSLAEALRNTARAHGLLGDLTSEYRYYQEAVPLLEEAYGPEHPRVREAKARLAELEKSV